MAKRALELTYQFMDITQLKDSCWEMCITGLEKHRECSEQAKQTRTKKLSEKNDFNLTLVTVILTGNLTQHL